MATLQGSVVFGIVLGYVVTGAFVGYWQPWTCNEMTAGGYLEAKEEWSPDFEHTHLQECYNVASAQYSETGGIQLVASPAGVLCWDEGGIDEATFKKRQEAKGPNIPGLPEGPGPDDSEEDVPVEEPATEETAPEAPAKEEVEKPEPAPGN